MKTALRLLTRSAELLLPAMLLVSQQVSAGSGEDAVARAAAAVQAAVPRAQADPGHPIFHVSSPAQWMNDPNGPVFYEGWYHLFYQLHPFSDASGPKYWGHVRSRDLVKWEPLPIALWPSTDMGESEVWSGCCTITSQGEPMIFYTSIAPGQPAQTHAAQWAALGDHDLIHWQKLSNNPVIPETVNGATKIYEWRDPFIFQEAGRTFLVAGGNLNQTKGGAAVVNIYEAENSTLTQWQYRGVLFHLPGASARTAECPNFFKLDNQWVLFVSPYGKVQYFVGDFDLTTCRFSARTNGLLDVGRNFYAPNTMQVPDGRRIVWGWVNGFPGGRGWNGCLTLPRVLSLSPEGQLLQEPALQLAQLRGHAFRQVDIPLDENGRTFALPSTNTFEIAAHVELNSADGLAFEFKSAKSNAPPTTVRLHQATSAFLRGNGLVSVDVGSDRELDVRLFPDRSVLEVFVNKRICATQVIAALDPDSSLVIHPTETGVSLKSLEIWPMKTIW